MKIEIIRFRKRNLDEALHAMEQKLQEYADHNAYFNLAEPGLQIQYMEDQKMWMVAQVVLT